MLPKVAVSRVVFVVIVARFVVLSPFVYDGAVDMEATGKYVAARQPFYRTHSARVDESLEVVTKRIPPLAAGVRH